MGLRAQVFYKMRKKGLEKLTPDLGVRDLPECLAQNECKNTEKLLVEDSRVYKVLVKKRKRYKRTHTIKKIRNIIFKAQIKKNQNHPYVPQFGCMPNSHPKVGTALSSLCRSTKHCYNQGQPDIGFDVLV